MIQENESFPSMKFVSKMEINTANIENTELKSLKRQTQ